jgi:hypothetical protein
MRPMRITSRGFAAVTGGLVSAVVLAGCSSNSTKPTVLPSLQTTSATATGTSSIETSPAVVSTAQSPTATAPETTTASPTPMSASPSPTAESPLASEATNFVHNYYKTAAAALHSKVALSQWKTLYLPSCNVCGGDYAAVSNALAAGDRYEGGEYRLKSATIRDISADGAFLDITFYVTAAKVFDAHGKLIAHQDQTKLRHGTVGASRAQGVWKVTQIHDGVQ